MPIIIVVQRSRRATIMGLLLVAFIGLTACGGRGEEPRPQALTYRPGQPLDAELAEAGRDEELRLEQITYSAADGERVPALFAIPTAEEPVGCLVYQGGFGQTKEQVPDVRRGAASLGLATFTIDPRNGGARGGIEQALAAMKEPETLLDMVRNTVVDLRMGIDYLQRRSECRTNIAYMGTSFGAVIGALLAAQDRRIKAAILTSTGPTFKSGILISNLAAQEIADFPAMVPGAATDPDLLAHAVGILAPYDPGAWVGKIAPRPVMLINGRFDPAVPPIDALELAAAARDPKAVLYFRGGHDPFAPGPDQPTVAARVAEFLSDHLGLPAPS